MFEVIHQLPSVCSPVASLFTGCCCCLTRGVSPRWNQPASILSAHFFLIRWFVSLGVNRSQPPPQLFMKMLDSGIFFFVFVGWGGHLRMKHEGVKRFKSGATACLSAFGVGALIRKNGLRSHLSQKPDTGMCLHPSEPHTERFTFPHFQTAF